MRLHPTIYIYVIHQELVSAILEMSYENVRSDVCHTISTKHQLYRFTSYNRVTSHCKQNHKVQNQIAKCFDI